MIREEGLRLQEKEMDGLRRAWTNRKARMRQRILRREYHHPGGGRTIERGVVSLIFFPYCTYPFPAGPPSLFVISLIFSFVGGEVEGETNGG